MEILKARQSEFDQIFVSQSIASTRNTTFWWALQTQTEKSFLSQSEHSRHRTLRTQYLHLGVFLWKQYIIFASYKLLQVAKFLFMYSFTHTNILFLFRRLPTKIVIFINVCYQIKRFSGDSFSFFGNRFF